MCDQEAGEGAEKCNLLPNDIRMWAGWLIGPMAKLVFSSRFLMGEERMSCTEKGTMNPCWVEVKVILNFG